MKFFKQFNTHNEYEEYINGNRVSYPNVSKCEEETNVHLNDVGRIVDIDDYIDKYLTFVALENTTFKFSGTTGNNVYYSLDNGETWTELPHDTETPVVSGNTKILFKGECVPTNEGIGKFISNGNFNIEGNIMSLLYGDNFSGQTSLEGMDYAFYELFHQNDKLINARNLRLPATTLSPHCYERMFRLCVNLATVPSILPATTLTERCYFEMFNKTALSKPPKLPATTMVYQCYGWMLANNKNLITVSSDYLPATTLADGCYEEMFDNCQNLINAPELPATTLVGSCYQQMFTDCSSLVKAPSSIGTSATTFAPYDSCFRMFGNCISLVTTPELPATNLGHTCYEKMFEGCTALTSVPSVIGNSATTMEQGSCNNMFAGCTSLVNAPELPATTLNESCYQGMFNGCSSLTTAPELPATILDILCYDSMFAGCTSLTTAPELPATTLVRNCYYGMFSGCTSLNYIKCLATDISATDCTNNWVANVAPTGTFVKNEDMNNWRVCNDGIPYGWIVENIPNYFKFIAREDGTFKFSGSTSTNTLQYSLDNGETWVALANDTNTPTVIAGNSILFKGECVAQSNGIGTFISSGEFDAEGNVMSLLYGDNFSDKTSLQDKNYVFYELFSGNDNLINAQQLLLPATTLSNGCYSSMFNGCTSLETAPELPATILTNNCYEYMFAGCTNLRIAPVLPATTLTNSCYYSMFDGCNKLNYIKCLATDISAVSATTNWVSDVASAGTFVKDENMNGWTLDSVNGIPNGWTVRDNAINTYLTFIAREDGTFKFSGSESNTLEYSLDNGTTWVALANNTDTPIVSSGDSIMWKGEYIPQLSGGIGTFISSGEFDAEGNVMSLLYGDDFSDKKSLLGIRGVFKSLFKNGKLVNGEQILIPSVVLTHTCYGKMFYNCNKLTIAPELPATTLYQYCYAGMFQNCKSLVNAPVLPAMKLANECYSYMFAGCSSSLILPELPASTLVGSCYHSMFAASSISAVPSNYLHSTKLSAWCYYGMFANCWNLTTAPELPATTLPDSCYREMFNNSALVNPPSSIGNSATTVANSACNNMFGGCSSLTTAPELPATTLAKNCYYGMFSGCRSLTTAPELPATTLADGCYQNMFRGCTSLVNTPEIPVTTLKTSCYQGMFRGCTSLTTAPVLPADKLVNSCYKEMFYECTKLNYIKCLATDISAASATTNWVVNVAPTGVFIKDENMTDWEIDSINGIPIGWTTNNNAINTYLTFTAREDSTFKFNGSGTKPNTLQYSLDNGITWVALANNTDTPTVSSGDSIMWKGECRPTNFNGGIGKFISSGEFDAKGNPMSLLYGDEYENQTDLTNKNFAFVGLFSGNTNLVRGDQMLLPATILSDYCYKDMFYGCSSLTNIPELPATTLAPYCYQNMFRECSSITVAPKLPATELAESCYRSMFNSCSSLTLAPELPATTLVDWCYYYMFQGCTSLTSAPELPSTTLASYCYDGMFDSCTSLTTAPVLPATALTTNCYNAMFYGCSSLITAPELPATTLATQCYRRMFYGCSRLNYIKCLATKISANDCTFQWVTDVAPTGLFIKEEKTNWGIGVNGIPVGWTAKNYTINKYLTFTARENGTFKFSGSTTANTLQYSLDDGTTWVALAHDTETPTVSSGSSILFKSSGLTPQNENGIGTFISTGQYDAKGNVMSLYYGDNFSGQTSLEGKTSAFRKLFQENDKLVNAKDLVLPAKTLANSAYTYMFFECTSLISVPELLATTLANSCYHNMFDACKGLTTIPVDYLPVTTLKERCYENMFSGCDNLTNLPNLPATALTNNCYDYMFSHCYALKTIPSDYLPATTLANGCYYGMFIDCTGLTSAQLELPATTLTQSCYRSMFNSCTSLTTGPSVIGNSATTMGNSACYGMFYGCTSLTTAPELPATTLANECYYRMFQGCTGLTSAPELPATTLANSCYYEMFKGCTSLTSAPELPATTLANNCYQNMFQGCTSLTTATYIGNSATTMANSACCEMFSDCTALVHAPALPALSLSGTNNCYIYMFKGCSSLETAPELPATNLGYNCYYGMFSACTSLTTASELPATNLAGQCYQQMFIGCSALTSAPSILPAETLVNNCYYDMFNGCKSLEKAPVLPAKTLVSQCYRNMFRNCSKLNYIKCFATNISASNCTTDWTNSVSPTGTFVKALSMNNWGRGTSGIPNGWNIKNTTSDKYLTFIPSEDSTFKFSGTGSNTLQYSLDNGETWVVLTNNTDTPTVTAGNSILFKGECTPTNNGIGRFISSGEFDIQGNVMSLLCNDNFSGQTSLADYDYAFVGLFSGNTNVVSAENFALEMDVLSNNCYESMFQGCTSLITTPELLATTLANNCYKNMFEGCSSLINAPELPATTLANNCYAYMFKDCTSITSAPVLCADTLTSGSYQGMFNGCSNLNYIKCLATDISATDCTSNWTNGVAEKGTFFKDENMNNWTTGVNGIPVGWTVRENAPNIYLTFTAKEDGTFKFSGSTTANTLQYSLDSGETWTALAHNTDTPTVSSGDSIMFKGNCSPNNSGIGKFMSSGQFDAKGNPLSLIYNDNFSAKTATTGRTFINLFSGNTNIVSAEQVLLKATALTDYCYDAMFQNCTSLVNAPELPATKLAQYCYENMFSACTSLTTAPELPVTTLSNFCYQGMFRGCSSLTTAPELPATTLANNCYQNMFYGCSSLTSAPVLPATTLANDCYRAMFSNCSSLTTAPELPATTLTSLCYRYMFHGCTSLTGVPTNYLPSTTLANGCYQGMFDGCTSLTTAPSVLPATTLANECYVDMFKACTALTTAPELPATNLGYNCYRQMFSGCSSLNYIKCLATNISASNCTYYWTNGVASTGTFVKALSMNNWGRGNSGIPNGWNIKNTTSDKYLTFVPSENSTFKFSGSTTANTLSYSLDNGETWVALAHDTNTPTVTAGNSILFKGECTPTNNGIGKFISSGEFDIQGNVMSLLCNDNFSGQTSLADYDYAFVGLFSGNTNVVSAENLALDATILSDSCYESMFEGCTALITVPELPATALTTNCYQSMFEGCSSLTTIPELPAETLTNNCYENMFKGCSSIVKAPVLNATTLATASYQGMFSGCTKLNNIKCLATNISATNCTTNWVASVASAGTFIKDENMSEWTVDSVNGIPVGWTVRENAPNIYLTFIAREDGTFKFSGSTTANTLQYSLDNGETWVVLTNNTDTPTVNSGDSIMFKGSCTPNNSGIGKFISSGQFDAKGNPLSLIYPNAFSAKTATTGRSFIFLFSGNTNIVSAEQVLLKATALTDYCYDAMFQNCTSLVNAPELPATKLAQYCYQYMFQGCTGLTTVPELPATTLANGCYEEMFNGCSSLTTAPSILPATTLANYCYKNMFNGCSSLTTAPELPATTLAQQCYLQMFNGCTGLTSAQLELPATTLAGACYEGMFKGCRSLTTAPELPATTLAVTCYKNMFNGCSSLTTVPELPATTLANECYNNMFQGCTSLTSAPELPATTLANNCYQGMFFGCSSLTTAPELPATTLATSCYQNMFQNCTSLTTAPSSIGNSATTVANSACTEMFRGCTGLTTTPELPATTLGERSYQGMFYECKSLISTPELPATTFGRDCYQSMFKYCTSLTTAPTILPATTLASQCYYQMFQGCTGLTTAPELPATTLANSCYQEMFSGCTSLTTGPSVIGNSATTMVASACTGMFNRCTSLTTAPELPATTLATSCYQWMFYACTNLNYIKCLATDISATNCTYGWVQGVAPTGTFVKAASMGSWTIGYNGIPTNWEVEDNIVDKYLTFIPSENSTFKFSGSTTANTLSYSLDDGETWVALAHYTNTPTVTAGSSILFKGECVPQSTSGIGKFISSGRFDIEGSVMSLLYGDNYLGETSLNNYSYVFYELFSGNANVVNAAQMLIPARTLTNSCYRRMFADCSSLITTPAVLGVTLAESCYESMYAGCISLVNAPSLLGSTLANSCYKSIFSGCTAITSVLSSYLPATTLAESCYENMFIGCTSLTTVPDLPATTLANNCYKSMFKGCTSLTTTSSSIGTTATTMSNSACTNMFEGCTGLTTSPALPATTLANYCYYEMFKGCISLVNAPTLSADVLAESCYSNMFVGCTNLTSAPSLASSALTTNCYENMFAGCTSLVVVGALTADTLASGSYQGMFSGCSSLNYIKCLATDISATNCTTNWVAGVASAGTFVKQENMSGWTVDSVNGIPSGWTVEEDIKYENQYLTFEVLSDGYIGWTYIMEDDGTNFPIKTIEYSINNGTWTSITNSRTADSAFYVHAGDRVRFKGTNTMYANASKRKNNAGFGVPDCGGKDKIPAASTNQFTTAQVNVYGNIMSLFYGDNFIGNDEFPSSSKWECIGIFKRMHTLISAENLILPAKTLHERTYNALFSYATNLIKAPVLPATKMATYCYSYTFEWCNIDYLKCLAITNASSAFDNWVTSNQKNNDSNGIFVKAANTTINYSRGNSGVPSAWTVQTE